MLLRYLAGGQHEAFLSDWGHRCSVQYAIGWTRPGRWEPTTRHSDEDALEGVGIWLPSRLGRCATGSDDGRAFQDVRQHLLRRTSDRLCTSHYYIRWSHAHRRCL